MIYFMHLFTIFEAQWVFEVSGCGWKEAFRGFASRRSGDTMCSTFQRMKCLNELSIRDIYSKKIEQGDGKSKTVQPPSVEELHDDQD